MPTRDAWTAWVFMLVLSHAHCVTSHRSHGPGGLGVWFLHVQNETLDLGFSKCAPSRDAFEGWGGQGIPGRIERQLGLCSIFYLFFLPLGLLLFCVLDLELMPKKKKLFLKSFEITEFVYQL